jgi:hypothetical protein
MVNNSTNINKANNHLLSQIIEKKRKKNTTYDVGDLVPDPSMSRPLFVPGAVQYVLSSPTLSKAVRNIQIKDVIL